MSGPYGFRQDFYDPSALSYNPNEFPSAPPPYHHQVTPVYPGALPAHPSVGSHNGYYWIPSHSYSGVPPHAVRGGTDSDGSEIYVGRAHIEGDWCPAKIVPDRSEAYVAFGGKEHCVNSFEVLCEQRFEWVPCFGGNVPHNAVCGGQTCDGERLYIGRTYHEGSSTVGKVHPSHNCLYIPYGGDEVKYENYEILVRL